MEQNKENSVEVTAADSEVMVWSCQTEQELKPIIHLEMEEEKKMKLLPTEVDRQMLMCTTNEKSAASSSGSCLNIEEKMEVDFYMTTHGTENPSATAFSPEVVNAILKHLNKENLLNCRLVSEDWNEFCMTHLKKSGSMLRLASRKIADYVDLLKRTGQPPLLPIRICIVRHEAKNIPDFNAIESDLDLLIQTSGQKSIVALKLAFDVPENVGDPSVIPILKQLGPNLQSLKLSVYSYDEDHGNLDSAAALVTAFDRELDLVFPNLKMLTIDPDAHGDWSHNREDWSLYSLIVGRCPKLEHFNFSGTLEYEDAVIRIPVGTLRRLQLSMDGCIALNKQIVENNVGQIVGPAPVLETLMFSSGSTLIRDDLEREARRRAMHLILLTFSSTLKFLSCHISDSKEGPHSFPPFSSVMGALERFAILADQVEFVDCLPVHLNADEIDFTPDYLPKLSSVTIPIGLFWGNGTGGVVSSNIFTSVTSLSFQVSGGYVDNSIHVKNSALSVESIQTSLHHSFGIFPKVNKLGLIGGAEQEVYMKRIVKEIMSHRFSTGIQEFSISGYNQDYLGELLFELDNPPSSSITLCNFPATLLDSGDVKRAIGNLFKEFGVLADDLKVTEECEPGNRVLSIDIVPREHCLKSIQKLILLNKYYESALTLDYMDNSEQHQATPTKRSLHLPALARHLPSLRILELSECILSNAPSSAGAAACKIAREIEARFANWTVNVLY